MVQKREEDRGENEGKHNVLLQQDDSDWSTRRPITDAARQ